MSARGFAQTAIGYTEQEIFADAMGVNEEDLPGYDDGEDHEATDELSQVTGWNGEGLPDEEIAANALRPYDQGDDIITDRPNQLDYELRSEAEIEQRDQQIAARDEYIAQLEAANDPQRQQRAAVQREEARYQIIANPDQVINEYGAMQQELQQRQLRDLQSSFDRAHQEYGSNFEEAAAELDALATQGRTDPNAAAEVRSIVNAPDPGYALMQRRHMVNSLSTMPRPFYERRSRALSSHRTVDVSDQVDIADQDGGFGDERTENYLFNSAFDDSRDHPHHRDY